MPSPSSVLAFLGSAVVWALLGPAVRFPDAEAAGEIRVGYNASISTIEAVVAAALNAAYFAGAWVAMHASPAQRLLGLRVVDEHTGERLSAGQALTRWAGLWGPFALVAVWAAGARGLGAVYLALPAAWALALLVSALRDRRRQAWHDRWSNAVVLPARVR